jgi:hypothetical protein
MLKLDPTILKIDEEQERANIFLDSNNIKIKKENGKKYISVPFGFLVELYDIIKFIELSKEFGHKIKICHEEYKNK